MTQRAIVGVVALFMGIVITVMALAAKKIIGFELAMLMLIALLGMYVGFGFLIFVYRFVEKLK
jgi:hypothetical protein